LVAVICFYFDFKQCCLKFINILIEITHMKTRPIFLAITLLAGCAISRKVEYDSIYAEVPNFNQRIGLATWDQREQVLKADGRKPDFVGYMRSGVGIAYPMGTENGMPFTDNASASISASLKKKGNTVNVVLTQPTEQKSHILEQLRKTKTNRLVLIDCRQFVSDGYGEISLTYNLQVNIYSENGDLTKEKTFNGIKPIGGSKMWGAGKYHEYMPEAFKKLIEEIFNDPEIRAALQHG
jgi:hypothetical protein